MLVHAPVGASVTPHVSLSHCVHLFCCATQRTTGQLHTVRPFSCFWVKTSQRIAVVQPHCVKEASWSMRSTHHSGWPSRFVDFHLFCRKVPRGKPRGSDHEPSSLRRSSTHFHLLHRKSLILRATADKENGAGTAAFPYQSCFCGFVRAGQRPTSMSPVFSRLSVLPATDKAKSQTCARTFGHLGQPWKTAVKKKKL